MGSLFKAVLKKERGRYFRKLSFSALYAAFAIVCLIPAYFVQPILVLLVPLVIAPFLFALQATNHNINLKREQSTKDFFKFFPLYFRGSFRGAYRLALSFLEGFGVYFLVFFVLGFLLAYGKLTNDPAFMEQLSTFIEQGSFPTVEETEELLLSSPVLAEALSVASVTSLAAAILMFLHNSGTSSLKVYIAFSTGAMLPMHETAKVYSRGLSSFRGSFFRDYYKATWFLIPAVIAAYALGAVPAHLYLNCTDFQAGVVGSASVTLALFLALPYYFDVLEVLYHRHGTIFAQASISLSLDALNEIKASQKMSDDQLKDVQKFMEQSKAALEEMKEEEKRKAAAEEGKEEGSAGEKPDDAKGSESGGDPSSTPPDDKKK